MNTTRILALFGAVALVLSVLSACSDSPDASSGPDGPPPPSTTPAEVPPEGSGHNNVDTMFVQMMIVHHEGAMEMSEMALEKSVSDQVRDLAAGIVQAQAPEIELMTGWLTSKAEPLPTMETQGGMEHEGMQMDGMGQAQAMDELEQRTGQDFDRRFLELMIEHHRGAIAMAEEVLEDGLNDDVSDLAEKIIADQEAEISTMQALLQRQ